MEGQGKDGSSSSSFIHQHIKKRHVKSMRKNTEER